MRARLTRDRWGLECANKVASSPKHPLKTPSWLYDSGGVSSDKGPSYLLSTMTRRDSDFLCKKKAVEAFLRLESGEWLTAKRDDFFLFFLLLFQDIFFAGHDLENCSSGEAGDLEKAYAQFFNDDDRIATNFEQRIRGISFSGIFFMFQKIKSEYSPSLSTNPAWNSGNLPMPQFRTTQLVVKAIYSNDPAAFKYSNEHKVSRG